MTLREVEIRYIAHVLRLHGGNKARAAQHLGVSLKTVYNKLPAVREYERSKQVAGIRADPLR